MRSSLQIVLIAGLLCLLAPIARGDSEIVIAIRYLQAQGTSHSHLYLYREDGKFLRQLTNDNSGQDSGPIFSADGETIVFIREKPNNVREFWSVKPRGPDLKNSMLRRTGTRRQKVRRILQMSNHEKQDRQMRQVRPLSQRHRPQLQFQLTNRRTVRSN